MTDDADPHVSERANALRSRQRAAVRRLARHLDRPDALVRFAVADIPLAAIRTFLDERASIPDWIGDAVERAVRAALAI